MAYKTYKPESLQIPGINLPAWFNSVDPLTFQEAQGSKLSVDKIGLQNQLEQEKLDILAKKKEASERLAKENSEENIDPDAFLERAKKIYLETGNYDDAVNVMEDQRKREEEKRRAEKVSVSNFGNGYVMITKPDGTYEFKPGPVGVGGGKEKKPPSIDMDFWDERDGSTTKINVNDPAELEIARKLNLKKGSKPWDYDPADYLAAKEKEESEARAKELKEGPGILEKLYNSFTGKEQPKQVVMRKKKDVIPKAR